MAKNSDKDRTNQNPETLKARIVEYLDAIRDATIKNGHEEDVGIPLAIAGALGSFTASHMITNGIKPDEELGSILGGMLTESLMAVTKRFDDKFGGDIDNLVKIKKEIDDDPTGTRH